MKMITPPRQWVSMSRTVWWISYKRNSSHSRWEPLQEASILLWLHRHQITTPMWLPRHPWCPHSHQVFSSLLQTWEMWVNDVQYWPCHQSQSSIQGYNFFFYRLFCFLFHAVSAFLPVSIQLNFSLSRLPILLPGNNGFTCPAFSSFLFISFHQPKGAALPSCFSMCVCLSEWRSVCVSRDLVNLRVWWAFGVCLCTHMQEISIPLAPLVESWGHPLLLGPPHLRLLWV